MTDSSQSPGGGPEPLGLFSRLRRQLRYIPRVARLVFGVTRWGGVAWIGALVAQGLIPVAIVFLSRRLVDDLAALVDSAGTATGAGFDGLLVWIGGLAGLMILNEVLSKWVVYLQVVQADLVKDHVQSLIHEKALALDYEYFESRAYYDQLYRARVDAISRPIALLESLGALLQNSITLVAMLGVLFTFGWWVPLVLLVSSVPLLVVALRNATLVNAWRLGATEPSRRADYYDELMTTRAPAAEVRVYGLGPVLARTYRELRTGLRDSRKALARSEALSGIGAGLVGLVALGACLGRVAWMAQQGRISLGQVAMFYQAFAHGQRGMRAQLGKLSEAYSNIMFLENLFEFLSLEPEGTEQAGNPAEGLSRGIELRDIRFRYPGVELPAVDGLDLDLPAGQITAVMGVNGSGKTTVLRLLCRLFDPQSGTIEWDGADLRGLDRETLWSRIAVLFQEPVRYQVSAAENIAKGDWRSEPGAEEIERAAVAAGVDPAIRRLPDGYETVLGKWFGGADLSGGEWQRLALARAFVRRADLVLLDEPTSALDSWASADWFRRFRELVDGRTAVLVTHSLHTARYADRIHVFQDGRVLESGTHEELLEVEGEYARSWKAQMSAHSQEPSAPPRA